MENSKKTEIFVEKAKKIHGQRYSYSGVEYFNCRTKVCITCPEHGEFWQTPSAHLSGKGCPKCAHRGLSKEELVKEFRKVHGDKYDYSKTAGDKMNDKSVIRCPIHGEFLQSPTKHLKGRGCPKCAADKRLREKTLKTAEFVEKANAIHKNKYDYSKSVYTGTYDKIRIICQKHGEFMQRANDHLSGHGCPFCGTNISHGESEVSEFVKSLGFDVDTRNRTVLGGGKEIDILLPEKGVGIEYDGLLWHCTKFKDKYYHLRKTEECAEAGIRLIHVFEDEWLKKKEIVKSMLSVILGVVERTIFATECDVRKIDENTSKEFLDKNHISGSDDSEINLGLFDADELVSVMSFKKREIGQYDIIRFCCKLNTSVVGAAGELLSYFIKTYSPDLVSVFCDRRWETGDAYEKIGFKLSHTTEPKCFFTNGNNVGNRFRSGISCGDESMVYDCGDSAYIWKKEGF